MDLISEAIRDVEQTTLTWYSCWPGFSPWGGSRDPVVSTAALTRYRYGTQKTDLDLDFSRQEPWTISAMSLHLKAAQQAGT